jgi:hypothetical protein
MGSMMQDLAFAIPGVDEAMSFAEIMKCNPFSEHIAVAHTFIREQTCQIDGILRHSLRYSTDRTHPPIPLVPNCTRESSGKTESTQWAVWTYDQTG